MNVRRLFSVSVVSASLSITGFAGAQQEKPRPGVQVQAGPAQVQVQPGQPVQPGQAGRQAHWQNTDQKLATCIAIANQEEIAIAKYADEKSKNRDVKDFAEMLAKDHQSFLQKLQKYAPEATSEGYLDNVPRTTAVKVQTNRPANEPNTVAVQQTAGTQEVDGQHLDFVQLHREIAEECIRSAKEAMNKKDPKEFDECFIGHQIAKHAEMKTKLVVFERHATGDLKQIINDGIETTERHLKKAEKIMKDLAKADRDNDKK